MAYSKKIFQLYSLITLGMIGYSMILYTFSDLLIPKFIINITVLPISLYVIFIKYAQKTFSSILVYTLSMVGIGSVVLAADYISWGIWSKKLYNPDGETIALLYSEAFAFLCIIGVLTVFYSLYRRFKKIPSKKRRG